MGDQPDLAVAQRQWRDCALKWLELALECIGNSEDCLAMAQDAAGNNLRSLRAELAQAMQKRLLEMRTEKAYLDALDEARLRPKTLTRPRPQR
jgi:hypothetical protein